MGLNELKVDFLGSNLHMKADDTKLIYDWRGGYLNPRTNWLWMVFSGKDINGEEIGVNLLHLLIVFIILKTLISILG